MAINLPSANEKLRSASRGLCVNSPSGGQSLSAQAYAVVKSRLRLSLLPRDPVDPALPSLCPRMHTFLRRVTGSLPAYTPLILYRVEFCFRSRFDLVLTPPTPSLNDLCLCLHNGRQHGSHGQSYSLYKAS